MQTQKATLDLNYKSETSNIDKDALYFVNWENLQGVEDLVLIFACMGLSFSGRHPHFDTIKHLLDLTHPVNPNQQIPQQPKAEDFKLPKLKSL
jgi:hypothetical protein